MSLAFAVLLAAAVPEPPPPPPPLHSNAPARPRTSWLTLVDGKNLPQSVAALYESLLRERHGAELLTPRPPLAPVKLEFRSEYSEFDIEEGPLAGHWQFFDPVRADPKAPLWPSQAWRAVVGTGDDYQVTVHLYCAPDPAACAALRVEAQAIRAPTHWQLRDSAAYEQWLAIVRAETCASDIDDMTPPRYPAAALRVCAYGVATLRVFVNACGEVRDATIAISARNRDLDQAALDAARTWHLPLDYLDVDGFDGWAVVPVNFVNPCDVPTVENVE